MLTGIHHWQRQERIIYGRPCDAAVRDEVARIGAQRVFICTTRSLTREPGGIVDRIQKALGASYVGRFDAMPAHSPRPAVIACAAAAREAKADLLVAVGGGSVIDAVKVVQLCLWRNLTAPDDLDAYITGYNVGHKAAAWERETPSVRAIAVPTTFSGAEFTTFGGVTDTRTGIKSSVGFKNQIPISVILDPAATLATPLWLLLSTGMRAVDHCIECYLSPNAQPFADATSVHALKMLLRALPRLKEQPDDLANRLDCQMAMWISILGLSVGVSVGASHGIGRVMGGLFGVPHGRTSCVTLAPVLRWNAPVNAVRQAELADAVGLKHANLADSVADLVHRLGEPERLGEVGVGRDKFAELAEKCLASGYLAANPRPIKSAADIIEILELAA
ncbi:MAG: iron-containing alcohol dehydrogenase [Alphaproteobacteria bacterium]